MRTSVIFALACGLGCPLVALALRLGLGLGAAGSETADVAVRVGLAVLGAILALSVGVVARRESRTPLWSNLVLGAALVAGATWSLGAAVDEVRRVRDPETLPLYDLTDAPLPDGATGFVRVRGYLRDEMTLDEYQVPDGERPNQNEQAAAKLVPLLGTREVVIKADEAGRVVVARLPGAFEVPPASKELAGTLQPLPKGTFEALFAVASDVDASKVQGVMLDTMRVPTPEGAWTTIGLTLGAMLLGCGLIATGAQTAGASGVSRGEGKNS